MNTPEQEAIRAELTELYQCRHKFGVATKESAVRKQELERRLWALIHPRQADRYAQTVRLDKVLGDIPPTPEPKPEVGPIDEWNWSEDA